MGTVETDFSTAHNDLRESQHTSHTSGFHANSADIIQQETVTAISNLANATLTDRETMDAMQATITTLNTQLAEANNLLLDNVNVMEILKEKVAAYEANGGGRGGGTVDVEEVIEGQEAKPLSLPHTTARLMDPSVITQASSTPDVLNAIKKKQPL